MIEQWFDETQLAGFRRCANGQAFEFAFAVAQMFGEAKLPVQSRLNYREISQRNGRTILAHFHLYKENRGSGFGTDKPRKRAAQKRVRNRR
jgi:hypothetical protein